MMNALGIAHRRRAVRDTLTALSARQIAWLVFLVTLLIYFSLVPWVTRRWWLTGDEPHYLVVTHSLLTDGDLDLSNNYQEKDFTLFYTGGQIDPHVTIGPDGGAYPSHTIGLSVVLLPAYALGYLIFGSHAGVLYFLTTMGALLAANTYLLCYEVTGRKFSSLLAWVTTAFTVPVMHYAYQVYPEIMGALLLVWSLRHIRRGGQTKPHIWLMVGLCIGFLPWLVTRFMPLSAFLGAAALLAIAVGDGTRRWRRLSIIALCLPVILSGGVMVAFDLHSYGRITPAVGAGDTGKQIPDFVRSPSLEKFAAGLSGSLFDQDAGVLVYSPVYALLFVGILFLLRTRRNDGLLLTLPIASVCMAAAWVGFIPGWGIPYRYLVVILPLAGVLLAYSLQRIASPVFRALGLLLFLISLTRTPLLLQDPLLAQALGMQGDSAAWVAYNRLLPFPLREYIPSFRRQIAAIYAHGRAAGEIGQPVQDPEAEGLSEGLASTQMVAWAGREVHERGHILDRWWPDDEERARLFPASEYTTCFRVKSERGIPSETIVAVIDVSIEQGVLAQRDVAREDLPEAGYGVFCLQFHYPGHQQLRLRVLFTDQADLWIDWVRMTTPAQSRRSILSGFWLALVVAFTAYYYLRYRNKAEPSGDEIPPGHLNVGKRRGNSAFAVVAELLVALTIVVIFGGHLYYVLIPRTFEAERLPHLTGEVVLDDGASGGKAAHASRDMDKNSLVHGPFEFFGPGEYEARFRMKASGASADVEVAVIDVCGSASGVLALETIESDDFSEADRYQHFDVSFSNPARQALEFRVFFVGAADLWVDKITLRKLE